MRFYCPLMSYRRDNSLSVPCEKEDCMWWDEENKDCLVASYLKNQIQPQFPLTQQSVASAWYDPEEDDIVEDDGIGYGYELTTTADSYFTDLFDKI